MNRFYLPYSQKQPTKVFYQKRVLKNLAKFTGKYLCQTLFFNKVEGLRPAILLKKRLWHRCFPVNFAKFLRTGVKALSIRKRALAQMFHWVLNTTLKFAKILLYKCEQSAGAERISHLFNKTKAQ